MSYAYIQEAWGSNISKSIMKADNYLKKSPLLNSNMQKMTSEEFLCNKVDKHLLECSDCRKKFQNQRMEFMALLLTGYLIIYLLKR